MNKKLTVFSLLAAFGILSTGVTFISANSPVQATTVPNKTATNQTQSAVTLTTTEQQLIQQALTEQKNKEIAETFWNEVFNKHNPEVIKTMVSEDYEQHNPDYATGRDAFYNAISGYLQSAPESSAVIDNIGADGDYVYIHNHPKENANDRGQAAVDIFKIIDGKIVAHWDVLQNVPETAQNTNTMFFTK